MPQNTSIYAHFRRVWEENLEEKRQALFLTNQATCLELRFELKISSPPNEG